MSVNIGDMRELYVFDSTYVLTAQYMLPMRAGGRTGIDVQPLIGRFCGAFVNIDVTTPKGCATTVDVSVYKYVVTLVISLLTVNVMMDRYAQPRHFRPELRVGLGETDKVVEQVVSWFRLCHCSGYH
jgi:hypothetical protein